MAAAAQRSTFQQILDVIGDITGTSRNINTARLDGAQRINQALANLRQAIVSLREKAQRVRDQILALQAIEDPNVLTERNRELLEQHEQQLQQIREGLNQLQSDISAKAQEVDAAASAQDEAAVAGIADIDGLMQEIQAANEALDTIERDIVNLRRITGAAGAPPPANPPRPPPSAGPGRRSTALPPVPTHTPVLDPETQLQALPSVALASAELPAVPGIRSSVVRRPSRNAALAHNARVERIIRGTPQGNEPPLQDNEKFLIDIPAVGGGRKRSGGRRSTRRKRGGYTYPRTRTHVRPRRKVQHKKTVSKKHKKGKKTKRKRRRHRR